MDRVRLSYNIARIRKQIFSVVAFSGFAAVLVATIVGHGLDLYLLFVHSVISTLLFGLVGYGLGIFYQWMVEEPLIESYREEAKIRIEELKNSGPQRVVMEMQVSDLQQGLKSVDTVHNKDGALLVRAGAVLNDRLIKLLRENNIGSIKVEGQKNISTEARVAQQMQGL